MVPGNEQFDFFVRDLQTTSATWKIVYFHYPPFVSGGYQVEDLRELCPIMEQYGVDLVINSHTIVYERSHPICDGKVDFANGIVYSLELQAIDEHGRLFDKFCLYKESTGRRTYV